MLLTVDVGNTNIVFGIFQNDKLMRTFRVLTKENRTSDELGLLVLQYFSSVEVTPEEIEAVILVTVVPGIMPTVSRAMEQYIGRSPLVVDQDIFPELKYEADERLGADRAVCCDAAMVQYGKPVIVLDLGTATTIDAVSENGYYLGGCILPGMQVSTEALSSQAAQLPPVDLLRPQTVLGYSLIEQIQVGCVSGYIGGLDYLLRETIREMNCGDSVRVVATGGLAQRVADHLPLIDLVDHSLVLDGLRILYQKHVEAQKEEA